MFCHGKKISATSSQNQSAGYSLIEMMLAVAIFATLLTISIPTYSQHLVTQNRLAAKTQLLKVAASLEQYYVENNSYAGASLTKLGFKDSSNQYVLSMVSDDNHFTVMARPVGKQLADDCGMLSIDSQGAKTPSGKENGVVCWA